MLVDRAPQVAQPAVDPDEHLVEVPLIAGARAPPAQLVGVGLPELGAPPPDRLVAHRDTACEHQLLDLTQAEREPEVQPHAVVDDLDRVAVALIRRRCGAHPTDPPSSPTLTNVTVPSQRSFGLSHAGEATCADPRGDQLHAFRAAWINVTVTSPSIRFLTGWVRGRARVNLVRRMKDLILLSARRRADTLRR